MHNLSFHPESHRVSETDLTLYFLVPDADDSVVPIAMETMNAALVATMAKVLAYLTVHPEAINYKLLNRDDPYTSPPEIQGCFLGITHWPVGDHSAIQLISRLVTDIDSGTVIRRRHFH